MLDICNVCKKWKTVHRCRKTKKLICPSCYDKDRYHDPSKREQCSRCKEVKRVAERTKDGPVCSNCYNKDPSKRSQCSRCKEVKRVGERTESGPVCSNCYNKDPSKREQCSRCKEVKQVRKRTEDGPICSNCHNKSRVGCCNQCKKTKI